MSTEKKYTDIMIDIETLDTRPTAIILTMAAVCFDLGKHSKNAPELYQTIYGPDQKRLYGRTRSSETDAWWRNQPIEIREEVLSGKVVLKAALADLIHFIQDHSDQEHVRIWAKSPRFDLCILEHAMEQCCLIKPWDFRAERDVRTYIMGSMKAKIVEHANPHHALHDAHHQIEQLCWAYRDMNK